MAAATGHPGGRRDLRRRRGGHRRPRCPGRFLAAPSDPLALAHLRSQCGRRGALGYFVTRLQERLPLSSYRRPLLGTGLCGGLSTFSTMQVEIVRTIDAGDYMLALGYGAASITAGYLALHLASITVRRVRISR